MTPTLTRFETSGFLPVWTPKIPIDNEEALHCHIVDASQTIRNYLERMRRSMMKRVEECIESHGRHFEHLL
jgi:hypothetical protein